MKAARPLREKNMIFNYRLTGLDCDVISRALASDVDDALVKLATALAVRSLKVCHQSAGRYRLRRYSADWANAEETWHIR